jgi:hypothetical protein
MKNKPPTFFLGIIGGCFTQQEKIPLSNLYHQQLKKMVHEKIGINCRITVSQGFGLEYHERLSELLNKTKIDGVLLQLPKMQFQKAGIVVHYFENEMLYSYLHPFLFRRRKFGWKEVEKTKFNNTIGLGKRKISKAIIDPLELPPQGSRVGGFRLRDLNYIIASLVQLDTWAVEEGLNVVTQFTQACQKNNIPVFIFGPTPYPTSFWRNRICRKINTALDAKLSCGGVPFSYYEDRTDQQGNLLTTGDGIHLSVHGHGFLARFLSDALCPWIKKIVTQAT